MFNNKSGAISSQQQFVFHGKGLPFFIICLTNLLLTIITLGIYFPWALVRSRKYIYDNMELNGVRFVYSASGSAFFVSWLLIGMLFAIASIICALINQMLILLPLLVLIIVMPLMIVKGLRYQALMTSLNNVRFGFNCSNRQAMWVMLVLPVMLSIAAGLIIVGSAMMMGTPSGMTSLFVNITAIALIGLVAAGVVNGVIYGNWMRLLGGNANFGTLRFSINISIKRCIISFLLSMLVLLPFIVVILGLMSSLMFSLVSEISVVGKNGLDREAFMLANISRIFICYGLYFAGLLACSVFIATALRNMFINGLRLGETITFRSTITFWGLLVQIIVLSVVTVVTLGLAYPWMKMRLVRYMADNTLVIGNLDELELKDTGEQVESGFFASVSFGTVPALPFI